jgi:methionyl-tRNA formyltransferase
MKVVFMGTPEFAVPSLELIAKKYDVKAVVTVPDKPKGRGQKLGYSPIKEKALELGIKVLQPVSLKDEDFINELKEINPDIICVIAFRILPEECFNIAKIASFNIHGSLLPKFRGAAPINRAIMAGESNTGLTSFVLKKIVDTGDILLKKEVEITSYMTAGELHDIMMPIAAELSIETIEYLKQGNFLTSKQDDSLSSPAPKIFREECQITSNKNVKDAINHIHGLSPYPAAFVFIDGTEFKILKVQESQERISKGDFQINKKFLLGFESGTLEVLELKPQGKNAVLTKNFINGWRGSKEGKF